MTTIEPALHDWEWAAVLAGRKLSPFQGDFDATDVGEDGKPLAAITSAVEHISSAQWRPDAIIALENYLLPNDDPRKITREMLGALTEVLGAAVLWNQSQEAAGRDMASGEESVAVVSRFITAAYSYLPPEGA